MDAGAWLRGLGLGLYEGNFRESEIEADVLPELTEADLEKLGLPLTPQKRILKAIANLGDEDEATRPTSVVRPSPKDAAERRQLTVMFCDLVGSTALSARLAKANWRCCRTTRGMIDAVSSEANIRMSCQCSPYHSDSPLYPIIQQLTFAAGFRPDDDNDDKLDRLEKVLVSDEGDRPLFASLLGLAGRRASWNPEPDAASSGLAHHRRLWIVARTGPSWR
jgi:SAM domain (Sterile alpha motif)